MKTKPHIQLCKQDFTKNVIDSHINQCINEVTTSLDPVPKIYKNMVASLNEDDVDLLNEVPEFSKIKTTLYEHRNAALGLKQLNFKKVAEVVVPKKYENFLLADFIDEIDNIRIWVNSKISLAMQLLEYAPNRLTKFSVYTLI